MRIGLFATQLIAIGLLIHGCGGSGSTVAQDLPATVPVVRVDFAPGTTTLADPTRGETGWAGDLAQAHEPDIAAEVAAGFPLLRSQIRLDAYIERDLPPEWLASLDAGFALVRKHGAKVIPRVAYNSPTLQSGQSLGPTALQPDASLDQVRAHIAQIGPVFARNRDVIQAIEAGFIGAWGEWHTSASNLTTLEGKQAVLGALVDAFPPDRPLLLRYPADLRAAYPRTPAAGGRIGIHNDCYLNGDDDGGTWTGDRAGLREYVRRLTLAAPYGGETCAIAEPINDCASALAEGASLRMSFLNRYGDSRRYQDAWRAQGCLDEIRQRLGHRFVLDGASVDLPEVVAGGRLRITVSLRNIGWAPAYGERSLTVVLDAPGLAAPVHVPVAGVDPRDWWPEADQRARSGSAAIALQFDIMVPPDMPAGLTDIALALPDGASTLRDDPRYAISFANADRPGQRQRRDPASGGFRTGLVVRIAPKAP